jgi:EpsI family protein
MHVRALTLAVLFLCCAGFLELRVGAATIPAREPLIGLPLAIADWQGRVGPALDGRVLAVLGADDYTTRVYTDRFGHQAGLYIGYYATQRQGDSIHSPMNCLPGAGWQPIVLDRLLLNVGLTGSQSLPQKVSVTVNKVLIQKGEDRQLVLYWYQSHGRIIASEYSAKAMLFVDAMRSGRTDAGLVRIVVPIDARSSRGELDAQNSAVSFAEALMPLLPRQLPQ